MVTQSAVGNPYLYTGREYDPESGLYFYRARHYDPVTGRFLQRDPLGYVDGLSAYEYGRGAPSTRIDALGLQSEAEELHDDLRKAKGMLQDAEGAIQANKQKVIDNTDYVKSALAALEQEQAALAALGGDRSCADPAAWRREFLKRLQALKDARALVDYLSRCLSASWSALMEAYDRRHAAQTLRARAARDLSRLLLDSRTAVEVAGVPPGTATTARVPNARDVARRKYRLPGQGPF